MVEGTSKNGHVSPSKRFSFSGLNLFSRKSSKSNASYSSGSSDQSAPSFSSAASASSGSTVDSPVHPEKKKEKKWFGKSKSKKDKTMEPTPVNSITKTYSDANVTYPTHSHSNDENNKASASKISSTPNFKDISTKSSGKVREDERKKGEEGSSEGVPSPDKKIEREKESGSDSDGGISKIKRVISKKLLTKVPSKSEKDKGREEFQDSPSLTQNTASPSIQHSSSSIKVSKPVPLPPAPLSSSSFRVMNRYSNNLTVKQAQSPRNLPVLNSASNNIREFRTKERRTRREAIPNLGASSNFTSTSSFDTRKMGDNSEFSSISSFDYVKRRVSQVHVRSPLLAQALEKSLTKEHFTELMSSSQYGETDSLHCDTLSYEGSEMEDEEQSGGMAKMVAIYDFAGERMDDLTFWEGDIIVILAMFEDGWWLGLRVESNAIGRVPSNYMDPLPAGSKVVRALADYSGESEEDMSIEEGDIIVITNKNQDWWFGESGDQSGWIPSNYVEDIDAMIREQYMAST
eukprot:TRINITY_DN2908_c0_g3_i5.p1 TRINITY_DN2908_c0_g3~~TRINITY_DN2908_c0_g3_i5.p1  ORF type:complete len:517 (-),score=217.94 TRINITY_DN2908_c0_g3_i5:23-1573(-)